MEEMIVKATIKESAIKLFATQIDFDKYKTFKVTSCKSKKASHAGTFQSSLRTHLDHSMARRPIHLYLIFEKSSSTNWIFNLQ